MYSYIKNLENRLTAEQKYALQRIYEPCVVGTPLSDSRRDICILPDGEIRSYGRLYTKQHLGDKGTVAYYSSKDGGISWDLNYSHGKMNSCTYIDGADIYITSVDTFTNDEFEKGLWVYRSKIGPDDPDPEVIQISDESYTTSFLPVKSHYTDRIWFTAQNEDNCNPVFFYSDDFGKTWNKRELLNSFSFETTFPHKGKRWSCSSGTEPYVVELSQEKMMMIIRTPTDCFYQSFSYDCGETWSKPEPSTFYGTNTTAFLLKLSDGRVITFWNNTKPLPQPNYKISSPPADQYIIDGLSENGFTNRDAAHAAICENGGDTWIGYREIVLNRIRNNIDFRYIGGVASSLDKSVHQFQAYELPFNKILVSAGQNPAARTIIIFDIDWLYETQRSEDFLKGIGDITVHTYLKSVSGHHVEEVGNGHCALNRTYNAYLMPDPDGGYNEALYISKQHDNRMINDIGGVTWNFPAAKNGRVTVDLKLLEKQAKFILTDRWYNTCDKYAASQSPFWFELDVEDIGKEFTKINIDFDTEKGQASVLIGEELFFKVKMTSPCPTGISYLILQCDTDGDSEGFYVKLLKKE